MHNTITREYIPSIKRLFTFTHRALCIVILFSVMTAFVFAQSDDFDALVGLVPGTSVPTWVLQRGVPVANTDLRNSATQVYSFPSSDPAAPHIVRVKANVMTEIILTVPAIKRTTYQDMFFNNRYTRELFRQDAKETIYFIPSNNLVLVMDVVTGEVVRIEKSVRTSDITQEEAPLDTPNKRLIITIVIASVLVFAGVMTMIMISMIRWKPKGDAHILPPEAYPR